MNGTHPCRGTRRSRSQSLVLIFIAWAMTVALLAHPEPARGHDELIASSPSDSAVTSPAPTAVSLIFSAELTTGGEAISVTGTDGREWVAGPADVTGFEITAELQQGMPDGEYEVRWRVVSADAHPISGIFTFSVAHSVDERTRPTGRASVSAESVARDTHSPSGDSRDHVPVLAPAWILGVTVGIVVLALIGLLVVRGRTRRR